MKKTPKLLSSLKHFIDSTPEEIRGDDVSPHITPISEQFETTSEVVRNTVRNVAEEWLSAPAQDDVKDRIELVRKRVNNAFEEANSVFGVLKQELEVQSVKLADLTKEIEEKTEKSSQLTSLASVSEEALRGFTSELEGRLRLALEKQQERLEEEEKREKVQQLVQIKREQRIGRAWNFVVFWFALIFGAVLGAIFQYYLPSIMVSIGM